MAIRVNDLVIDTKASFGDNFLLADISPAFKYVNGERTKEIEGYRYTVVLPNLKLEKMSVKVPNLTPLVNIEKDEIPVMSKVKFSNLSASAYFSNGSIGISAKADTVSFEK